MLIAQLSDPHVRPKGVLYHDVVDSNAGLTDAVEHVRALTTTPDLVLVTGDLVDHGEPAEYHQVREILDGLPVPYLVIPGNHDDRENFRRAFADHPYLPRTGPLHFCVDDHPVRIIGLDSTVPGHHHGHLDAAGLDWLATTLARDTTKPTLIMLHHPPFVSGIPYLDEYRYFSGAELAAVVERAPNVEIVVCGHVHRSMVRRWARTVVVTCPSTATQIDLQLEASAAPSSHAGPRGYLLHLWDEREGMISHANHIGVFAGPYPFA
ncbi:phosphodiesterase [Mycolicibacterium sp. P1-18]|uniref:phosphodiesterase n=1 Tax=Mycolicibacterium sp. P1-18 TaxID=2024615 RepID=UPI0011F185AE|nr:phosphodiesterase [Mycolicibacterium sp. P1-18]KAA0100866.1 phosphodiesterase [Mycolicibacterium sp. P1-18]